jgi:hypothetical protein
MQNSLYCGLQKMAKSNIFEDLNIYIYIYIYLDAHVCYFCLAKNKKLFKIDILQVCAINHWLHHVVVQNTGME